MLIIIYGTILKDVIFSPLNLEVLGQM